MTIKKLLFPAAALALSAAALLFMNSAPLKMQGGYFIIEKGEALKGAAAELKEKNFINSTNLFLSLAVIKNKTTILPGKYRIYKGMSSWEIIKKISAGDIVRRRVTIPEGFNIYEIAERLKDNDITGDLLDYAFDRDFLKSIGIDRPSAEGFLFPDTYLLAESQDPREVISIMHNRYKSIMQSMNISKNTNPDEYRVLIMASLIEKEAALQMEKPYISSVFHNRLSRKISLGCDPTVQYALKKFRERLTLRDLKYDSPYNTYIYRGLPPGPICSPGKNSIIAALKPADSRYLFFVSRNDGSHYFSKTLAEHNKAVDFYQRGIMNGFIDRQRN